jgi:NAD(P) transhydrogenase
MASIGLTEAQAREKYPNVVVGRAGYEEIARGQIAGIEDGLLKLVVDGATRKLLGAQIVGDGATDLVHLAELALINGNEIGVFLENVLNFPTLGEAYRVASLDALDALRASGKSPLAEAA